MPPDPLSFSVDTHIFRELGELLVGRDSTALLELIKNCYDADATRVVVTALDLSTPERGTIVIRDNGCGMDEIRFRLGFLRIASRLKEGGTRRSDYFQRRYTGSKGIGRLAAHKLAKHMHVASIRGAPGARAGQAITATIDWARIEAQDTLGQLSDEITLEQDELAKPAPVGTTITLTRLRRPWSDKERTRFVAECRSFQVPSALRDPLPASIFGPTLLFKTPRLRDAASKDPGCEVELEGEFREGDSYWEPLLTMTSWVMEIDCKTDKNKVKYAIAPSKGTRKECEIAERKEFEHDHPNPKHGPFFQARILIRDEKIQDKLVREWSQRISGHNVYLEGFRVLPYGEAGDDWLGLDADVGRRSWRRDPLTKAMVEEEKDEAGDWQLSVLTNKSYTGAVFLTQDDAPTLRMLVNREGFVAEQEYDVLVEILKRSLDLATRTRAAAYFPAKKKAREEKNAAEAKQTAEGSPPLLPPHGGATKALSEMEPPAAIATATAAALGSVNEARRLLSAGGQNEKVAQQLELTHTAIAEVITAADRIGDEAAMGRVLASLGTQMASFVHEINSMLSTAVAIHDAIGRIREDREVPSSTRTRLGPVYQSAGDLRRQIERQAAYMLEITSTDARRRRSRQSLGERFDAASRLVAPATDRRGIRLVNEIPNRLKSPPMFPAELTVVFSNLLTNAVKAAGKGGGIRATGRSSSRGTVVTVENTGTAVGLEESERWFRAFESTTAEIDSTLGQGMGLGLTITRNILEQYGATIRFVEPSEGFATAVEVQFPGDKESP